MQQTIDSTSDTVARAAGHSTRFSERLIHLLSFVPDDKLAWMPSPTSRSSLRLVAHCALINRFFADVITGKMPERMPSPQEFFSSVRQAEETITTRESAVTLVMETTTELCSAIATVTPETIDATRKSPFGAIEARFWINQAGDHLAGHAGQLEYLQTLWGDMDDHMS